MRISKILATVTAAAALVAVGVASVPSKAEAYVIYSRVYSPVVVVRPPVVYYAPRPVYVAPPQAVWVPPHYEGPYFVPGHWA